MNILIIGANSAIAEATARRYAEGGHHLFLVARDAERLNVLASDLKIRGATAVETAVLDAAQLDKHGLLLDNVFDKLKSLDIALIAYGTLPDQKRCEQDLEYALREFQVNATSVLSLCTLLGNRLQQQGHGTLAVIASVAGDRGRQSNYLYGTAKGAISIFLQGLRNRLQASGVQVLTIKPGFVDTPMTAAFPKGFLWAQPDAVARGIVRAIEKRRNIVYLPWFWRYIMLIIRAIPEAVFKRMSL